MSRDILVLGGSYFAGRSLVSFLMHNKNINVFVFNRGNIPLNMEKVVELRGDRTDAEAVRKNIPSKNWDLVVDFCGYTPDDVELILSFMPGTIKHYIFISTTTVYDHSSGFPLTETSPTVEKPQPELGEYAEYGLNKIKAEKLVEKLCVQKSIQWTILRPAIVYGMFNYAPRETYFFDLVEKYSPIIIPEDNLSLFTFVFVKDLSKIIIKCFSDSRAYNKVFNVAAPEYVSYGDYIKVLKNVTKKQMKIIKMSAIEIDEKRIPLPFPIDQHQIYSGYYLSQTLEFKFTPLLEGLRQTYEFYKLFCNN